MGRWFNHQRMIGKRIGNAKSELASQQVVDQGTHHFRAPASRQQWRLAIDKPHAEGNQIAHVAGGAHQSWR